MEKTFPKEKDGNYPVRISKCKDEKDIGMQSLVVRKNDIIANGKYLIIANTNQYLITRIEQNSVKLDEYVDMVWGTSASGYGKQKIKITEDGVEFRSPVDGKTVFIGPKESIKIQEDLDADIINAFDECTSPVADYDYTKTSMEKTHRWAKICLDVKKSDQAMYGIVQGGKFKDLRIESAKAINSMGFNGYGIGGEFGDDKKTLTEMLSWVMPNLYGKRL